MPPDCSTINPLTEPFCALQELGVLTGIAINIMIALAGLSSLFFMIIGGLKYITAGDNPKSLSAARNTLTWAVLGLVIAASAFGLTKFIARLGGGIPGLFGP